MKDLSQPPTAEARVGCKPGRRRWYWLATAPPSGSRAPLGCLGRAGTSAPGSSRAVMPLGSGPRIMARDAPRAGAFDAGAEDGEVHLHAAREAQLTNLDCVTVPGE